MLGFESLCQFLQQLLGYITLLQERSCPRQKALEKKFGSTIWEFILVEIISDVKIKQRSILKTRIRRAKHLFVKKPWGLVPSTS